MSAEILLVAPLDQGTKHLLTELRKRFSRSGDRVDIAQDHAEARKMFKDFPRDLIITFADIAPDETASAPDRYLGAQMLVWMEQEQQDVPSILISPVLDAPLNALFARLRNSRLRISGLDIYKDVADTAETLVKGRIKSVLDNQHNNSNLDIQSTKPGADDYRPHRDNPERSRHYLKIVIIASTDADQWRYEIVEEGGSGFRAGPRDLEVGRDVLSGLIGKSRNLLKLTEDFKDNLKYFGSDLLKELFRGKDNFWGDLNNGLGRVKVLTGLENGLGRVKICFSISPSADPIFFEALVSDDASNEFWMLDAPIYRSLSNYTFAGNPLFLCGSEPSLQPMNCLIVDSDAWGPTQFLTLPKLSYIKKECDTLEDLLKRRNSDIEKLCRERKVEYQPGQIVRMTTLSPAGKDYREQLINVLSGSLRWDLVHYSGHSFYDNGNGYLFLPPDIEGDRPLPFEFDVFASHLQGTRLVFLSGCQSSSIDFLTALARCRVGAAIGFRRQVVELHATEYTQFFYGRLFATNCLQHAFLEARQEMHKRYPNEWIWANPLLLVQYN